MVPSLHGCCSFPALLSVPALAHNLPHHRERLCFHPSCPRCIIPRALPTIVGTMHTPMCTCLRLRKERAMALATCPPRLVSTQLTISETPPRHALQRWWCARQADPDTARAFSDDAPQDFTAFSTQIATGAYLFYVARDSAEEVVGA